MPTATTRVLDDIWNNRTARDTAYSPETTNDRVCRHSHITDMSRCDNDISDRSSRRVHDIPSSLTWRQHQWETKGQGRVEGREEVGRKGSKSNGRADEKATAVTGLGRGATDHTADGVSLVKPTSRENDSPRTRVDTPPPPPPPTSPTMPVEQPAPTSKRPTHQQSRDGHILKNGMCQTREDVNRSRREVKSRSQGCSKVVDEDSDNVDVDHAHVEPQQPQPTRQTADVKTTDATNPYANGTGTTTPVGRSCGPPNVSNKGNRGGVKLWSRGCRADDENGDDNDVHHGHVEPQNPQMTCQTAYKEAADPSNPNVVK
ncbi:hypothetical protein BDN67DRAFT_1012599 [Paxillus ammoniavirescens]|nr:hypothetical protein BDN67DRAFT_1012599 [Paxillus ammoniavirescens]